CDPWNDPIQTAWPELANQKPDVLVLLGDNMYMDYKLGKNPIDLYKPNTFSPQLFSQKMYDNYKKQWEVKNFQTAIQSIKNIYAIWDDHDFAWNNSRGEGTPCTCVNTSPCKCGYVPPIKRMISKILFEQFRGALITKPITAEYPENPLKNGIPTGFTGLPYTGIEQTIHLSNAAHLHLLDGRSFRSEAGITGSLLGNSQKLGLVTALADTNIIHIIASGTTLNDWSNYNDFSWLQQEFKNRKVIVLSGDVHQPLMQKHNNIFEFTASAMAQPAKITTIFGRDSNIFGILDIDDNITLVKTQIFQLKKRNSKLVIRKSGEIDIATWGLKEFRDYAHEYPDSE
ncbi:MAG: hypothetical protein RL761_226, partial [Pseudomonadota bacterium]